MDKNHAAYMVGCTGHKGANSISRMGPSEGGARKQRKKTVFPVMWMDASSRLLKQLSFNKNIVRWVKNIKQTPINVEKLAISAPLA